MGVAAQQLPTQVKRGQSFTLEFLGEVAPAMNFASEAKLRSLAERFSSSEFH